VEIQPRLAALAKKNVEENGMTGGMQILTADFKTIRFEDLGKPVDVVVSNPPYRRIDSGRLNPDPEEAAARHEILAALPDVLAAAGRLLAPAGRCALIYPAERTVDLLTRMRRFSLEPKRIRYVHFIETEAAKRILVEGVKGGRPGAVVEPPLVVYDRNGGVTADATRFLAE
jgi:tRNA1Val (adenine37-N6)-methyltransferase